MMHSHDVHFEGIPVFRLNLDPNFYAEWVLLHHMANGKCPEPEVVDLIKRVVRPGDIVIDGGANVGFFSMIMAALVGDMGRVISFEPSPPNIERFQLNRDLNRFNNVALYTDALWQEVATLDFWPNRDSGQSALWSCVDSLDKIQVRALPLDALAGAVLSAGVRFMKLDVEGAEERVLRGAAELLGRGYPTYIVVELQPLALAQLDSHQDGMRALMRQHDYQMFLLREDCGLPALVPDRTVVKPAKRNVNVLFCRLDDVQAVWPEAVA